MASQEIEDDLDAPSEVIMDLRGKIENLREVNLDLNANLEKRRTGLKEAGNKIQQMSRNMQQFHTTLAAIDKQMEDNRSRLRDLDRMHKELQQEKSDINTELRFLSSEDAWAELNSGQQYDEEDLEQEKRFTDWARSDLSSKLNDLDLAKKRYADKVAENKKEWEMYKEDVWKSQMEAKTYLDDINEVDEQVVSRFKSLLKYGGQGLEETDRESINDTIRSIGIESAIRAESDKCMETQMVSWDIEEEIGQLLRHREQMWEQNSALMEDICALQSRNQRETIIPLKRSDKHTDLPNRDLAHQRRPSSAEESEENVPEHVGGGISLHKDWLVNNTGKKCKANMKGGSPESVVANERCTKLTDLSRLYKEPEIIQPNSDEVSTVQDTPMDAGSGQLELDSASGGQDLPSCDPPPQKDSESDENEPEPEVEERAEQSQPSLRSRHPQHLENTLMSDLMVSKIRGRAQGSNPQTGHKDAETVGGHNLHGLQATARRPSAFAFTPVQKNSRQKRN